MSTEEKKWTQEELEAFLQEQEQEEQEWEDEWDLSLSDEDEEVLRKKRMEEARERSRRHDIEHYEHQGFWLGREHQLLEELEAWLPRKEEEWYEIRHKEQRDLEEQIKEARATLDAFLEKKQSNVICDEASVYLDRLEELTGKYHSIVYCEDDRYESSGWLIREWRNYLGLKELMLRKTRSKDMARAIMSFC